jgi:hypothetical protein
MLPSHHFSFPFDRPVIEQRGMVTRIDVLLSARIQRVAVQMVPVRAA